MKKEGVEGIDELGHREYVGGYWELLGKLQFDFLLEQGLLPQQCLLDIACGSLRGGIHFIAYLEPGNYLGIEKEDRLLKLGIEQELDPELFRGKQPQFIISSTFEFNRFDKVPDKSLAQSLFTHLAENDISLCLSNLNAFVHSGHEFYATYFEGDSNGNPNFSHSHDVFRYSAKELEDMGQRHGWKTHLIGDWGHPWDQQMMLFFKP